MTHSIPCVNDLLYYIDFRRKIASVNDVVATCEAFYTPEAILQAKKEFFDVVGERDGMRFVNRRGKAGENAAKMNLEDLVNAMNKCDNDEITLPTFYSANYANVPHSDDGNVTLNQLLNVINGMKTQLANLEKKLSFEKTVVVSSAAHTDHPSDSNASTRPSTPSFAAVASSSSSSSSSSSFSNSSSVPTITQNDLTRALRLALPQRNEKANSAPTPKSVRKNGKQKVLSVESRVLSNHLRNKNIVIGKKPSSGTMSWSGAPLTIDCYIGRVDTSVSSEHIKADVESMGVTVVGIEENQTRHHLFKSFKLVIRKTDFDQLNAPEVWPEGVVFRRFRRPRPPTSGQVELAMHSK